MLRKLLVILSSMILIVSLFIVSNKPLFAPYSKNYEVYLDACSNSQKIVFVTDSDYSFIVGIKGESVCIEKETFNLESFLLKMKAHVIFSEEIEGKISYYAYSSKIKYIERIKNHIINLHIVVSGSSVKVGSPIIYGSF